MNTRLWPVPVADLHFTVPAESKEEATTMIQEILEALPYDPVFEMAATYTWTHFDFAPKEEDPDDA